MKISEYRKLISDYLDGIILVEPFVIVYLHEFKTQPAGMDKKSFLILERLFENIDAYSPSWTEKDEEEKPYRITEKTLKREVKRAFKELESIGQKDDHDASADLSPKI